MYYADHLIMYQVRVQAFPAEFKQIFAMLKVSCGQTFPPLSTIIRPS